MAELVGDGSARDKHAEDEYSVGVTTGQSACPGSRALRSVLGECMFSERVSRLYASFSPSSVERTVLRDLAQKGNDGNLVHC